MRCDSQVGHVVSVTMNQKRTRSAVHIQHTNRNPKRKLRILCRCTTVRNSCTAASTNSAR